ncbi:MAG: helix-turn-helix transcriptional regulator [Flavobacteriaceae bacterium]|nr:helix-turn-helix transcriptional regulator [Flavobacteriaceae bacterium]
MEGVFNEEVLKTFGKRIKAIRLQKKLRQNEIARRCGFHKSGYNSIEAGIRNISLVTLYKIAFALEEPVSSFFTDDTFRELFKQYQHSFKKIDEEEKKI